MRPLAVGLATTVTCALAAPATLERRDSSYYYGPHEGAKLGTDPSNSEGGHNNTLTHKYGHSATTITANIHLTQPTIWAPFADPTVIIDADTYRDIDIGKDDDDIKAAIFLNGERIDDGNNAGKDLDKSSHATTSGDDTKDVGEGSGTHHKGSWKWEEIPESDSKKVVDDSGVDVAGGHGTVDIDVSHVIKGGKGKDGKKEDSVKNGQKNGAGSSDGDDGRKGEDVSVKGDVTRTEKTGTHSGGTTPTLQTEATVVVQAAGSAAGQGTKEGKGLVHTVISAIFGTKTKTVASKATTTANTKVASATVAVTKEGKQGGSGAGKAGQGRTTEPRPATTKTPLGSTGEPKRDQVTKVQATVATTKSGLGDTKPGSGEAAKPKPVANTTPTVTTAHLATPTKGPGPVATTKVVSVGVTAKGTTTVHQGQTQRTTQITATAQTAKTTSIPKVTTAAPAPVKATTKITVTTKTAKVEAHATAAGVHPHGKPAPHPTKVATKAPPAVAQPIPAKEVTRTIVHTTTGGPAKTVKTTVTAVSSQTAVNVHVNGATTATSVKQAVSQGTTKVTVKSGGQHTTVAQISTKSTVVPEKQPIAKPAVATTKVQVHVTVASGGAPKAAKGTHKGAVKVDAPILPGKPKATLAVGLGASPTTTITTTATTVAVKADLGSLTELEDSLQDAYGSWSTGVKVGFNSYFNRIKQALRSGRSGAHKNEIWKVADEVFDDGNKEFEGLRQWLRIWIGEHAEEGKNVKEYADIIRKAGKAGSGRLGDITATEDDAEGSPVAVTFSIDFKPGKDVAEEELTMLERAIYKGVEGGKFTQPIAAGRDLEKLGEGLGVPKAIWDKVERINSAFGAADGGASSSGEGRTTVEKKTSVDGTGGVGGKGRVSVPANVSTTTSTTKHTSSAPIDSTTSSLETLIKSAQSSGTSASSTKAYLDLVNLLKSGKSKAGDEGLWKLIIKLYGDSQHNNDDLYHWLQIWINSHADEARGIKDVADLVNKAKATTSTTIKKTGGGGGKVVGSAGVGGGKGDVHVAGGSVKVVSSGSIGGGKGGVSTSVNTTTTTTSTSKGAATTTITSEKHTSTTIDSSPSSLEILLNAAQSSGAPSSSVKAYTNLVNLLKSGKAKPGDEAIWRVIIKLYGDRQANDDDLHRWLEIWINEHADEAKGNKEAVEIIKKVKATIGDKGGKVVIHGSKSGGNPAVSGGAGGGSGKGTKVTVSATTTSTASTTKHTSSADTTTPSSLDILIRSARTSGVPSDKLKDYTQLFEILKAGKTKPNDEALWKIIVKLYGAGETSGKESDLHRWILTWIKEHADDAIGLKEVMGIVKKVKVSVVEDGKTGTGGAGGKTVADGKGSVVGGEKGAVHVSANATTTTTTTASKSTVTSKHSSAIVDASPSSLEVLIKSQSSSSPETKGYTELFDVLKNGKTKPGDERLWKLVIKLYGDGHAKDNDLLHQWLEAWINEHTDDAKGFKEALTFVEKVWKGSNGKGGGGGKGGKVDAGSGTKGGVSISTTTTTTGNHTSSFDSTPSSLEVLLKSTKSSKIPADRLKGYTELFDLLKSGKVKARDDSVWKIVIRLFGNGKGYNDDEAYLFRWLRGWIHDHADDVKGSQNAEITKLIKLAQTDDSVTRVPGAIDVDLVDSDATPSALDRLLTRFSTPSGSKLSPEDFKSFSTISTLLRDGRTKTNDVGLWRLILKLFNSSAGQADRSLRRWLEAWIHEHENEEGIRGSKEFGDVIERVRKSWTTRMHDGDDGTLVELESDPGRWFDRWAQQHQAAVKGLGLALGDARKAFNILMNDFAHSTFPEGEDIDFEKWLTEWFKKNPRYSVLKQWEGLLPNARMLRILWRRKHFGIGHGDDLFTTGWFDSWTGANPDLGAVNKETREGIRQLTEDISKARFTAGDSDEVDRWFAIWFREHPQAAELKKWKGFAELVARLKRVVQRKVYRIHDDLASDFDSAATGDWFDRWIQVHPEDSNAKQTREAYRILVDDISKATFTKGDSDEVERWFEVWFRDHPGAVSLKKWKGFGELIAWLKRVVRKKVYRIRYEREHEGRGGDDGFGWIGEWLKDHRDDGKATGSDGGIFEGVFDSDEDKAHGHGEGAGDDGWGWVSEIGKSHNKDKTAATHTATVTKTVAPSPTSGTKTVVVATTHPSKPRKVEYEVVTTTRGVQKCRVLGRNVSRKAFLHSAGKRKRRVVRRIVRKKVIRRPRRIAPREEEEVDSDNAEDVEDVYEAEDAGDTTEVEGVEDVEDIDDVKGRHAHRHVVRGRRVRKPNGTVLFCTY